MGATDSSQGLFVQMLIISPVISWILKPGRFSKRRGFFYAVAFLVAIAVATVGMDLYEQEGNLYHVVGVNRDASYADIKRAFRQRSVELHPDKNPSPSAVEEFNRLRLAFDILGDAHKRPLYDLFGENAVEKDLWSLQIETLAGSLTYYALWAVITFITTLSDKARLARSWSLAACVVCFIMELNFYYGGGRLTPSLFPMMTVHDFIAMMHSLFPPFLNGCRAIGEYFHTDLAQKNFELGLELLKSNQAILLNMRQLHGEVASLSRRRPEVVKGDTVPAAAKKRLKMEKHPASVDHLIEDADTAKKLLELSIPKSEVQEESGGFGIPRWVWGLGVYFALNYFFD
ncbi:Molecular chaperone (DnaJ superfamily) [Plasmopara halstedii]|uniref:Molecular chaperone (DnaJ superfamily) n=1 Tax=Plasmopara halstedii TaxID=4781 RepID=A0A0P1ALR1_PLAHL|nr:Molecular chaperone (DnaJ superfamily) [Plasmopara halstedii]CEG41860.1 Molecular chaperone (DnaJ superfamily) [Plasmopara halstedii]|eukprot:XP_024578229.1 Molecular chaperone (DnaJ superfamily) [Plasmopara halstedii]